MIPFDRRRRALCLVLALSVLCGITASCSLNSSKPIPSPVSDMQCVVGMSDGVLLTWTAPEWVEGAEPVSYDIRVAKTEMKTADDWARATVVQGLTAPAQAGVRETQAVSGMSENTTYYLAMRVVGENGEESQFTNQMEVQTTLINQETSFSGLGLDSSAHESSEWLGHRLLVLDFWGPWCGWCREETPHLKELYRTFHDSDVVILGLACASSRADVEGYVSTEQIPWPNLIVNYAVPHQFMIEGYPTTVFLDSAGHELGRILGYRGYETLRTAVQYFLRTESGSRVDAGGGP